MTTRQAEETRNRVGLVLLISATVIGLMVLAVVLLVLPMFEKDPATHYKGLLTGALFALPAAAVYITVPRLFDRYDPEPWYALLGCLVWAACARLGSLFRSTRA